MPEPLLPDFEALVSRRDDTLDIARIALALALDEYPGLDVGPYLAWLDATAEAIADAADLAMPMSERLAVLDRQLFEIQGFRGNGDDYFDPRNSYLNDVIDRRLGIPITLSVIYLEVGWRLGLPLVPVSFPAHFLVATTGSRASSSTPATAAHASHRPSSWRGWHRWWATRSMRGSTCRS